MGNPIYIPAVLTDFALVAIGEEFGLAGTLAVVALYGMLMLRGFRTAVRAPHPFERFLVAGLTAGLVTQAWVIMAGNSKRAPITGVTMPFVSYGGSSLLTSFIILGLILRVSGLKSDVSSPKSRVRSPKATDHWSLVIVHCSSSISLALALLAATCGYWAVVRAETLRARDDNPRRVLYEQRIVRGRILDRNGIVLADVETAEGGIVTRRYPIPEAAPAIGYASLRYGAGGIEAAFDEELRGETGRSDWQAVWEELLHRPLQGHDVQLTLDATLQTQAQRALEGQAGAVVLLNAASGEILALASSPTFDPERLDEEWETLSEDPAAPLVNRATQGLYQPGAALQTIILAEALRENLADLTAPITDAMAVIHVDGTPLGCSEGITAPYTLAAAYAAACPSPVADLGERLGAAGLADAIERWSLTATPPPLEIPTEAADWVAGTLSTTATLRAEAIGQGTLTVSPLQMALVAGTLANKGTMPAPRLALRAQEHASIGEPHPVITPEEARALLATWQRFGDRCAGHWGVAVAGEEQPPHAWFLGVAPAEAPRYAIAVLLEHPAEPKAAINIGAALLRATSIP